VWNVNPKTTPISPEGIFKPGENKYPLAPGYQESYFTKKRYASEMDDENACFDTKQPWMNWSNTWSWKLSIKMKKIHPAIMKTI
jgi:hypothetical protein